MKPSCEERSSKYLEGIFETASEGIFVVDTDGHILRSNPAFDKLLGYGKGELKGKLFTEIVHKRAKVKKVTSAVKIHHFKRSSKSPIEMELINKEGIPVSVKLRSTLIKDDKSKVIEAVGIVEGLRNITEIEKSEKELVQIRTAVENANDAIAITDSNWKIIYSNRAFYKLFGYTIDEINRLGIPSIYKDFDIIKNVLQKIKKGKRWEGEIQTKSRGGREFTCLLRTSPIMGNRSSILGLLSIHTDITERKQAEEELEKTREFLEKVIENTTDGIMIGDLYGNITITNSALEKMTGLKKEELMGEHAAMFIPEDKEIRKMFRDKAAELLEKGNASYESVLKRRDGKHVEVDVNSSLIKDETGDYMAGVSIFRDVSERKKAETEIREGKEFLENLFKTSSDAILVTDPKGETTMVNDAMEKMVGYSRDELLGKHTSMLSPPDKELRSRIVRDLEKLFKEGRIHGYETVWQRKDGQQISVESNRSLLKDKDGQIIGGVSFTRDVTEKKKVESMLLQAEKLKSLGELAGGVAHDFNNVLAAILGRVQLLRMNLETPAGSKERRKVVLELKKGLEIIEKASLDGAETVRRIQEFSRRRTDDKNITRVDINELIVHVLEFTRTRWKNEAESKGIRIIIRKELSSLPPIAGSASELREVFTNLINNAIDAMPQGGKVKIKTLKNNSHISVMLEDTGIGIPKAIRDRIFDPFFTTKGPQSTGLGMSVSYGIINRHGGTIKMKSVEGKGTSFAIQLPLSREKIVEEGKTKTVIGKQRKAKILVIEDKIDVCEVLKDILANSGHEVETVSDGSEGVEIFRKDCFDLVFTDLGMPGKSGWQVAKEVKKISRKTPVALITGWEVQLESSKLKKSGVDLVVNKPFEVNQVLQLVQEGMELRKVRGCTKGK